MTDDTINDDMTMGGDRVVSASSAPKVRADKRSDRK